MDLPQNIMSESELTNRKPAKSTLVKDPTLSSDAKKVKAVAEPPIVLPEVGIAPERRGRKDPNAQFRRGLFDMLVVGVLATAITLVALYAVGHVETVSLLNGLLVKLYK